MFYSVLYGENKKTGGLVVRAGKGTFKLNSKRAKATAAKTAKTTTPAEAA